MGSEAKTMSDRSPETPSLAVTDLITELKTCFSSIDFQNVAKLLMNNQQEFLNKTHFLENEKDEILKENKKLNDLLKKKDSKFENFEKENKKLNDLLKRKDEKIESLEKENKKLNDLLKKKDEKIESLEKENDGLKDEVKKKQNEIGVYEKNLDVRVLNLEKISKELLALEVKKPKNVVVVAERSRPPPPPGFEEILDPKPKNEKVIIEIDDDDDDDDHGDRNLMKISSTRKRVSDEIKTVDNDDDDDDDDHGDRDLMKISSKRKRVSDEIKTVDSDDDTKCISILRRKKASKGVRQDYRKDNYNDKIPSRTQLTSHLKSPFYDSSSSD